MNEDAHEKIREVSLLTAVKGEYSIRPIYQTYGRMAVRLNHT